MRTNSFALILNMSHNFLRPLLKGGDVKNPFNEDPQASFAGWWIAAYNYHHIHNKTSFCAAFEGADQTFFGIHEDAETAAQCPACETDYLDPNQRQN
jgi:hypothetical protein